MLDFKNDLLTIHSRRGFYYFAKNIFINLSNLKVKNKSVQFFYGHHLFSDEIKNFKAIIQYLQKNFRIISYSNAVSILENGNVDENYICFSFDDGIKNCMRIAEFFTANNISAMFFVNPEVVENSKNELYIKEHCIKTLHKKELDFMDWDDMEHLKKSGHEIGNHTLSHKNLAVISKSELEDEIYTSKQILEKKTGTVKHFAWTYGLKKHISKRVFDFILKNGHKTAASAIRGQHFSKTDFSSNFILRDQIVFGEPMSFVQFFYGRNNHKQIKTHL